MSKKYALIDNGTVVNIIISENDPTTMTNLLCVEVDESIYTGCIYKDGEFTKVEILQNTANTLEV
jgi:hypothetical protein